MLPLEATLDGSPLACAEGSKTSSRFEDGNVTLACRFSLSGPAGTHRVLAVTLSVRRAQYAGFRLSAD